MSTNTIPYAKIFSFLNLPETISSHACILSGDFKEGLSIFSVLFALKLAGLSLESQKVNQIFNSYSEDIFFINKFGFEIEIDIIREIQELSYVKGQKRKIFIINHAELLNVYAANALLKLLEEPPEGIVFILTASSLSELMPTIVSRCTIFELRSVAKKILNTSFLVNLDKNFVKFYKQTGNIAFLLFENELSVNLDKNIDFNKCVLLASEIIESQEVTFINFLKAEAFLHLGLHFIVDRLLEKVLSSEIHFVEEFRNFHKSVEAFCLKMTKIFAEKSRAKDKNRFLKKIYIDFTNVILRRVINSQSINLLTNNYPENTINEIINLKQYIQSNLDVEHIFYNFFLTKVRNII